MVIFQIGVPIIMKVFLYIDIFNEALSLIVTFVILTLLFLSFLIIQENVSFK